MDRIFNMDNKFFVFMGRVADMILLNLYFVISCIPIITIGPALTALHYVTMKMVRNEESYIFREYVKSFKMNFKQGVIIHLIMMFTAILLFLDIRLVNQMQGNLSSVLHCVFLAIGVLYLMIWLYVYPVLSKFYNTIRNTFVNAFLMSIRHLPYTILMAVISIAPIAMLFLPNAQILNFLILAFVLCGFSFIAYCNAFLFVKIFDKYIPKEETAEKDTGSEDMLTDIENMPADPENILTVNENTAAGSSTAQTTAATAAAENTAAATDSTAAAAKNSAAAMNTTAGPENSAAAMNTAAAAENPAAAMNTAAAAENPAAAMNTKTADENPAAAMEDMPADAPAKEKQ